MAYRSPRDPKKPHPWWNAPIGRRVWKGGKPKQRAAVPKRTRAKIRSRLKRLFGTFHPSRPVPRSFGAELSRTAIYRNAYAAELEQARFLATEPTERPPRPKAPRVRSGGVYKKRALARIDGASHPRGRRR